jgi:hypothetical protein
MENTLCSNLQGDSERIAKKAVFHIPWVNRQMAAGSRRLMTVFGWRKLLLQFRFPANDLFTPASSAGTFFLLVQAADPD